MFLTKISHLITLNFILIALIIVSLNYDRKTKSFDHSLIDLGDTTLIDELHINNHKIVKLNRDDWYIDKMNYRIDPTKRRSLFRFLKKLKIKRPLSQNISDSLVANSLESSISLTSFNDQVPINSFKILNYQDEDILIKEGRVYSVYVPGYTIRIFDYLNFDTNDLRDRTVFQTTWKTLKTLKIQSSIKAENLTIQFGKSFYEVVGVSKLDTLKLYNYLKHVEHLRVMDFNSNPLLFDSLKQAEPLFKLFVEDIRYPIPVELWIYQKKQGYLGISSNISGVLSFKKQAIERIWMYKAYFERRN